MEEHVHNHLLPTKKGIADEFAGPQRYWLLSVGHVCGLRNVVSSYVNNQAQKSHSLECDRRGFEAWLILCFLSIMCAKILMLAYDCEPTSGNIKI